MRAIAGMPCVCLAPLCAQVPLSLVRSLFRFASVPFHHPAPISVSVSVSAYAYAYATYGPACPCVSDCHPPILSPACLCLQYDYDLEAMETQYVFLADVFYATFMIGVTNFLVWMLMGILLEVSRSEGTCTCCGFCRAAFMVCRRSSSGRCSVAHLDPPPPACSTDCAALHRDRTVHPLCLHLLPLLHPHYRNHRNYRYHFPM